MPGAAGADDHDVVVVRLELHRGSEDPRVVEDAGRGEADVEVGERDGREADPGPLHVPDVQPPDREPGLAAARGRVREQVKQSSLPADEVAQPSCSRT